MSSRTPTSRPPWSSARSCPCCARSSPSSRGCVTSLTLAPIMHGAAQWGMCIMLFGGGKVVLYTPHGFDPHEAWVLAERERAMTVMVVGDAMARPLGEALDQKSYDLSSVVSVGSGGAVYSAAVKAKLKEHLPNVLTIDTVGASRSEERRV